jgi:hypothetical protein
MEQLTNLGKKLWRHTLDPGRFGIPSTPKPHCQATRENIWPHATYACTYSNSLCSPIGRKTLKTAIRSPKLSPTVAELSAAAVYNSEQFFM